MTTDQTLACRRNNALSYARIYAQHGPVELMLAWIDRARKFKPLSEMQLFRIRLIIGIERYTELNLDQFKFEVKPCK